MTRNLYGLKQANRKETSPLAATRADAAGRPGQLVRLLRFAAAARLGWPGTRAPHTAARASRLACSSARAPASCDAMRPIAAAIFIGSQPASRWTKTSGSTSTSHIKPTWAPARSCAQPGRMDAGVKAEQRTPLVLRTRCLVGSHRLSQAHGPRKTVAACAGSLWASWLIGDRIS